MCCCWWQSLVRRWWSSKRKDVPTQEYYHHLLDIERTRLLWERRRPIPKQPISILTHTFFSSFSLASVSIQLVWRQPLHFLSLEHLFRPRSSPLSWIIGLYDYCSALPWLLFQFYRPFCVPFCVPCLYAGAVSAADRPQKHVKIYIPPYIPPGQPAQ